MKPNKILLILTLSLAFLFGFVVYLTTMGEVGMELDSAMDYAKAVMQEMKMYRESFPADEYSQAKTEYFKMWIIYLAVKVIPLLLFALSLFSLFWVCAWPKRCKKCKKLFALKREGTKLIGRKPAYIKIINKTYSKYSGEVTHESEQTILGTEYFYRTTYTCKHCSARRYLDFSEQTKELWQPQ